MEEFIELIKAALPKEGVPVTDENVQEALQGLAAYAANYVRLKKSGKGITGPSCPKDGWFPRKGVPFK